MSSRDPLALADLSEAAPAGENLELDPDFGALERAAQGDPKAEPPLPPDWKEAEKLAQSLLKRTRDLRVLTHLAVARLNRGSLPGFAEVLTQVRDQLEARWEQVYPRLDPEDDLDPTWRRNALSGLAAAGKVLRTLRDLPVATTRERTPLPWRDVAIFLGQLPVDPERPKLTEPAIRGAFTASAPERVAALREALGRAAQEAKNIPVAFEAKAGATSGPDLSPLHKLLTEMEQGLQRFEVVEAAPEAEATAGAAGAPAVAATVVTAGGGNVRAIAAVSRREDALYLLDLAAAYFRANEPSSPAPLLIDRARRLATLEFLDILRDIAPDGLRQAEVVAGPPSGE